MQYRDGTDGSVTDHPPLRMHSPTAQPAQQEPARHSLPFFNDTTSSPSGLPVCLMWFASRELGNCGLGRCIMPCPRSGIWRA